MNRKSRGTGLAAGDLMNAAGFGLLPGIAVWKAFEQGTFLASGTPVFDPLPVIPFFTSGECFAVSRIEMCLSVCCFAAAVLWLTVRKDSLTGNGDLLWTVFCVWGMIRALTENLRADPLLTAGTVNIFQVLFLLAADIPLVIWSRRLGKAQRNKVFTLLEWIAVLGCETVILLNSSGILSAGSRIGNLAVNAGCVILSILLILLAGKDSRAE